MADWFSRLRSHASRIFKRTSVSSGDKMAGGRSDARAPDRIGVGSRLVLRRTHRLKDVTLGEMSWDGKFLCYTLEDPWQDNKRRVSCIPEGVYKCVPHGWNNEPVKFKRVWEITGVPGRTAILIHAGNTAENTIGCILCGLARGEINGNRAILRSQEALNLLRKTLPKTFSIAII